MKKEQAIQIIRSGLRRPFPERPAGKPLPAEPQPPAEVSSLFEADLPSATQYRKVLVVDVARNSAAYVEFREFREQGVAEVVPESDDGYRPAGVFWRPGWAPIGEPREASEAELQAHGAAIEKHRARYEAYVRARESYEQAVEEWRAAFDRTVEDNAAADDAWRAEVRNWILEDPAHLLWAAGYWIDKEGALVQNIPWDGYDRLVEEEEITCLEVEARNRWNI